MTTTTKGWHETLDEHTRSRLYAWMRRTGERIMASERASRALQPECGTMLAVGAAAFDPWLDAEVAEEYLRCLRRGLDPAGALAGAKAHARLCVARHNAQRKRDACWQRWEGTADAKLDHLHRTLLADL